MSVGALRASGGRCADLEARVEMGNACNRNRGCRRGLVRACVREVRRRPRKAQEWRVAVRGMARVIPVVLVVLFPHCHPHNCAMASGPCQRA